MDQGYKMGVYRNGRTGQVRIGKVRYEDSRIRAIVDPKEEKTVFLCVADIGSMVSNKGISTYIGPKDRRYVYYKKWDKIIFCKPRTILYYCEQKLSSRPDVIEFLKGDVSKSFKYLRDKAPKSREMISDTPARRCHSRYNDNEEEEEEEEREEDVEESDGNVEPTRKTKKRKREEGKEYGKKEDESKRNDGDGKAIAMNTRIKIRRIDLKKARKELEKKQTKKKRKKPEVEQMFLTFRDRNHRLRGKNDRLMKTMVEYNDEIEELEEEINILSLHHSCENDKSNGT